MFGRHVTMKLKTNSAESPPALTKSLGVFNLTFKRDRGDKK
jgi:hypothetical protein